MLALTIRRNMLGPGRKGKIHADKKATGKRFILLMHLTTKLRKHWLSRS